MGYNCPWHNFSTRAVSLVKFCETFKWKKGINYFLLFPKKQKSSFSIQSSTSTKKKKTKYNKGVKK